jgi:hypothetical protein
MENYGLYGLLWDLWQRLCSMAPKTGFADDRWLSIERSSGFSDAGVKGVKTALAEHSTIERFR